MLGGDFDEAKEDFEMVGFDACLFFFLRSSKNLLACVIVQSDSHLRTGCKLAFTFRW